MNTVEKSDEETKREFAELVKHYRKHVFGWKQDRLATEANLGLHTIQDIENAQKKLLNNDIVGRLADAFKLTGAARDGFFTAAGIHIVTAPPPPIQLETLARSFFEDMKYPAMISDIFGDFHFINSYMLFLVGIPLESISRDFFYTSLGANTYRFFFDPALGAKGLYRTQWKSYVTINIYLFQQMAFPFRHEKRYQEVIQELQGYEEFEEIWNAATELSPEFVPTTTITLYNPLFNQATYKHIEFVMPRHLEQRYNAFFYLPDNEETEAIFKSFVREVYPPKVFQFTKSDRRGYTELK